MKSNNKVFLAVTCLALAALSCQAVTNLTGSPTSTPVDTDVPDVPNVTEAPSTEAPATG